MMLPRLNSLIEFAAGDNPPFPYTDIFNETWLVRLVVDWFAHNRSTDHPLKFLPTARWFSEASLPSAFLARSRGDSLAERWTRADTTIGQFTIGTKRKTDCELAPNAKQFVVVEAKVSSKLSAGVTNAPYFDQCARNVACIAELLKRADRNPDSFDTLAFHVLAPQSKIDANVFAIETQKQSIESKVRRRTDAYGGTHESWFTDWFLPQGQRA